MLALQVIVAFTSGLILNAASAELWFIASSKVAEIIVSTCISDPVGERSVTVGGVVSAVDVVVKLNSSLSFELLLASVLVTTK